MSVMKSSQILFSAVLTITCCGLSLLQAGQEGADAGTPVIVTPLRESCATCSTRASFEVYSGITERQRLVIRDHEAWRKVWKRIYAQRSPTPPLPEIDFAGEMLIVAAMGGKSTGGHGIVIDGANERDNRLEIKVRSISPGKGCMTTQALTAPVDIVRIKKTERTVVFRETETLHDCE